MKIVTVIIIALLTALPAVAEENPFKEYLPEDSRRPPDEIDKAIARDRAGKAAFSCGVEFFTAMHTSGGTFDDGVTVTMRKSQVVEVWSWNSGSSIWLKGFGDSKQTRALNVSSGISLLLQQCLEGP